LEALVRQYDGLHLEPLDGETVLTYLDGILAGANFFELPEGAGLRELMMLVRREGTDEWFSPPVERFRVAEQNRTGRSKRKGKDSVTYVHCIDGIMTAGRFNGIFDLQENFRKYQAGKADRVARNNAKRLKKARMPISWIDEEIEKMFAKFKEVIKTKSFLSSRDDFEFCLFFPQFITLRVHGYRQQCLRHCEVGRNISFPMKGSVSWFYEEHEIKNEVLISQTFSLKEHGGVEGHGGVKLLKILIDALELYRFKFLAVIRSQHPQEYGERMGDAFFGIPDLTPGGCGIRRPTAGIKGTHSKREYAHLERTGRKEVTAFFTSAVERFMDTSHLTAADASLHPHFLRAVCVDWMRDYLELTWEQIEKAIGDRAETLKGEYYTEKGRLQDASAVLASVSKKHGGQEAAKEESTMNTIALQSLGKNFDKLTEQVEKLTERAEAAERRAAEAEGRMSLAEQRAAHLEMNESYWRARAEFVMNETGFDTSDLPPELQLPVAAQREQAGVGA
jgi:hypothetical protein